MLNPNRVYIQADTFYAADRHLGIRHTAARRVRSFDPLPGAACGACLYRGPSSLQRNGGPRTIDRVKRDPRIVTDAAASRQTPGPGPRSDGLPNREKLAPSADQVPLDLARRIVELAEDKKAADIVLLDLAGLTTLADYFVICSGGSERQIEAIGRRRFVVFIDNNFYGNDREHFRAKLELLAQLRREGRLGDWVALSGMARPTALAALLVGAAASRLAVVYVLVWVPYARPQGLGAAAHGGRPLPDLLVAGVTAALPVVLDWRHGLLAAVLVAVATTGVAALARARIGGATGDVYGAIMRFHGWRAGSIGGILTVVAALGGARHRFPDRASCLPPGGGAR